MNRITFPMLTLGLSLASMTASAVSVVQRVTPADVRLNHKQWSVKVAKGKTNGLITFTIVHTLPEPTDLVADLKVYHSGKLIVTSTTPVRGGDEGQHILLLRLRGGYRRVQV